MNEKNLDYLKDNLKYMGFGEQLNEALQKQIELGHKEFSISYQTEIHSNPFNATLHFRKGEQSELYFFNKWEGAIRNDIGKTEQTFYLNKGQGITLKEGYNLLMGRAVHKELSDKEGQKYHAWLQLDKKEIDPSGNYKVNQYHQNYGYDLEKVLGAYPIKELGNHEQKENLLRSLERGNLQSVTFEKNGFAEKLFIEANPQFKSINAYDPNNSKISISALQKRYEVVSYDEKQAQGLFKQNSMQSPVKGPESKESTTQLKKGAKEGLDGKQKGPEKSKGLIEKKQGSEKKGMRIH